MDGFNFPPNDIVTITINRATLGSIPTDGIGKLLFMLDTEYASVGFYIVTASTEDASSSLRISLSTRNLNHEQDEEGTIFVVPGNIGLGIVYLPLVIR